MPPRPARIAAVLLLSLLWPGPASAQLDAALQLGAGAAGAGPTTRAAAATIAGADLSYFSRPTGPLRLELAGEVLGSVHEHTRARGAWSTSARAHLHGAARGVWAGTTLGGTSAPDIRVPVRSLAAGGWLRFGELDLHFGVARGVLGDSISQPGQPTVQRDPELASADSLIQQRIRTFTDVSAAAAWRRARWELGASASHRAVVGGSTSRRNRYHTAWRLDGVYHLSSQLALVAATGRYAEQLATVLPGGRYTTLSLRVALTRRGPARLAGDRAESSGRRFLAERLEDGRVRIALEAPAAGAVEIAGDFTDWEPVPLTRLHGNHWEVLLPLARGIHQVNVRFDGGTWQVPPATTPMGDGFGGLVGVFRVE